jgi:hypothetical protein
MTVEGSKVTVVSSKKNAFFLGNFRFVFILTCTVRIKALRTRDSLECYNKFHQLLKYLNIFTINCKYNKNESTQILLHIWKLSLKCMTSKQPPNCSVFLKYLWVENAFSFKIRKIIYFYFWILFLKYRKECV